jgi:hypothetical protein
MPDKDKMDRAAEIQKAIDDADERKRADAEATGQKLDKFLVSLDDCAKKIDSISSRMDALEKRRNDAECRRSENESEVNGEAEEPDESDERANGGKKPGEPRELVADRADAMRRHEARMADAQARADAVAAEFGERAPPPLSSETLHAYRCRLLRRYRHHSKEFADADLAAIEDPKLFAGIETRIYADARAAGASPQVPLDHLREIIRTDQSGRKISTFYGNPRAWMRQFSGSRRYVKSFKRSNN